MKNDIHVGMILERDFPPDDRPEKGVQLMAAQKILWNQTVQKMLDAYSTLAKK